MVETHLIPLVLQVALGHRKAISVFGTDWPTPDGTAVRDYIHIRDLAQAHLLALATSEPGTHRVYNLGSGTGFSVRQVISACERVTGLPIAAQDAPAAPATRPPSSPPANAPSPTSAGTRNTTT